MHDRYPIIAAIDKVAWVVAKVRFPLGRLKRGQKLGKFEMGRLPREGTSGRAFRSVSLSTPQVEEIDRFVGRFGQHLGYRGRSEFIAAAIREKLEREEARILRRKALADDKDDLDWDAVAKRS